MIEVNFCRAPSHMWVGWAEYENGMYYSSGKTMDDLVYHIKLNFYQNKRISARQIIIASKQSDPSEAPLDRMSKMFKTKYWYEKGEGYKSNQNKPMAPKKTTEKPVVDDTEYDYYDTLTTDNELIVYGVKRREVARYKMNSAKPFALPPVAPSVPTPVIPPYQQPYVWNGEPNGDDNGEGQGPAVL